MDTGALSLDQAPPLGIPALFFAGVPVAMLVAGVALAVASTAPESVWMPRTIGLAHVVTLGLLGMAMFGAMYQMTPVVAGQRVPRVGLAYGVFALIVLGTAGLAGGLAFSSRTALGFGLCALLVGVFTFAGQVGLALGRARTDTTVAGMRLAVASLAGLAVIGLLMGSSYVTLRFSLHRVSWLQLHVSWALGGWVGGLITAVSWQVVPMFYLASAVSRRAQRLCLGLLVAGLLGATVAHGARLAGLLDWRDATALGALPAAFAVGVVHPWMIWRALGRRRRRRVDPSVLFWRSGLVAAPLATAALIAALWGVRSAAMLFGWLALWGWAATIVHGMLSRIAPFLVWFHRFSPLVGIAEVPAIRTILPDGRVRTGLVLHLSALGLGTVAILTGSATAWTLAGVAVAGTGVVLGANLLHVFAERPAALSTGPGPSA